MKIRNGFVSNSSCSSFLIRNWECLDQKKLLSEEQIEKLVEYGFKPVNTYSTMALECADWRFESLAMPDDWEEPPLGYAYGVTCNQDDVIEYLVAHEIPFKALCHYGHQSVIFDGDVVYIIPNFGIEAEMHGIEDIDYHFYKGPIRNFFSIALKLLMGRWVGRPKTSANIVNVRSKNDYKTTTERILNMPSKGA